ncbi:MULTISPECIES: hypothetical protein [Streptomyces]|nr:MULTISPECIES: hypothetical protein [Streptomyces]
MPLVEATPMDEIVRVHERDSVRMCRRLARHGFLMGGSTGTVVSGAARWLERHDPAGALTSVAISADMGDRYIETVYDDAWVRSIYGDLDKEQEESNG